MDRKVSLLFCIDVLTATSCIHCVDLHFVGIGALYVRRRPRVRVEALQSGGGQERLVNKWLIV